jgi:DNA-binding XRE family transcriptional regulator
MKLFLLKENKAKMKNMSMIENKIMPNTTINERLNQDSQKVLFPKKLEKANKFLKKAGIPHDIMLSDASKKTMQTIDAAHLSSFIKQARLERNMTVDALAKLVEVEKSTISDLENQPNQTPLSIILKVFKALDAELGFVIRLQC